MTTPVKQVCGGNSPEMAYCTLLKQLVKDGLAAGGVDDCYENKDGYHRVLNMAYVPQVTYLNPKGTTVTVEAPPGAMIIGNCSTAGPVCGDGQESNKPMVNMAFIQPTETVAIKEWAEYHSNKKCWYPAVGMVKDRTPVAPGWDRNIFISPFAPMSQGKSGSELDEVQMLFIGAAALKPDVKQALKQSGDIIPALLMARRRIMVESDGDYLSPKAHPSMFGPVSEVLNPALALKMVNFCQSITLQTLPPRAQIQVTGDMFNSVGGVGHPEAFSERNFNTPDCISRVWRGPEFTKSIEVSAKASKSANGHPLTYHWFIVKGDPSLIKITSMCDMVGEEVKIDFDWSNNGFTDADGRVGHLYCVGLVVSDAGQFSAPVYVNVYKFGSEIRTYSDATGFPRLVSVTNRKKDTKGADWTPYTYMLPQRLWDTMEPVYGANGNVTGWTFTTGTKKTTQASSPCLCIDSPARGSVVEGVQALEVSGSNGLLWSLVLDRKTDIGKPGVFDFSTLTPGTHYLQAKCVLSATQTVVSEEVPFRVGDPFDIDLKGPEPMYSLRGPKPRQVAWRGLTDSVRIFTEDKSEEIVPAYFKIICSRSKTDYTGAVEIIEIDGSARNRILTELGTGQWFITVLAGDADGREGYSLNQYPMMITS